MKRNLGVRFIAGPAPMVEALRNGFEARGVPRRKIHYEEFNFR